MEPFDAAGVVIYSVQRDGQTLNFLSLVPLDDGFEKGIPGEGILGELTAEPHDIRPETFQANSLFLMFLHQTLAKFAGGFEELRRQATEIVHGELPVFDLRHDSQKDVASADALRHTIGVFEVQQQQLVRYHICPKFQIVSDRGVMRLPLWLRTKLVDEITKLTVNAIDG
ncbi:MAG: hypothetical protein KDA87_14075 [Planctomycetales bacterium]|nr:hypothetical protein [Planctomycetales bacterium]